MEEMDYVIGRVCRAVSILEKSRAFAYIIPEVGTNIAFSIENPQTVKDIVAIPGRIRRIKDFPKACERPEPGASDHLARFILEMRKYSPDVRAAINFAYNEKIVKVLKKYAEIKHYKIGLVNRIDEPEEVKRKDGASMPWKVKKAIENAGGIPQLKCEFGGEGKEDLSLLLGKDPVKIVYEVIEIAERVMEER